MIGLPGRCCFLTYRAREHFVHVHEIVAGVLFVAGIFIAVCDGETGRLDLANLEAGRLGLTACRPFRHVERVGVALVGANVGIRAIDAEARAKRVGSGLAVLPRLGVVVVESRHGEDAVAVAEEGRIGLCADRVGDEVIEVLVARLLKLFYTGV